MIDDRYTIDPYAYALIIGQGALVVGDMIDMITGDIMAGTYCNWPKREPRVFVIDKLAEHIIEPMQNLKVLNKCVEKNYSVL